MSLVERYRTRLVAAVIAVALFVQANVAGLPIEQTTKTIVLFTSGAVLAGLAVFKEPAEVEVVEEDEPVG